MAAHIATLTAPPLSGWRRNLGNAVPWMAVALFFCLLVQVFLAGAGLFRDATFLDWHATFVHAFEFLPLLMAVFAGIGRERVSMWMSIAILVLIELQYPTAPFMGPLTDTWAPALHPVNAVIITVLTVVLVLQRPPWQAKT